MHYVRNALKKFIVDDIREGDLVALLRTGGSMGAMQQFTTDKRLLVSTAERLQWNSLGRGEIGALPALSQLEQPPPSLLKSKAAAPDMVDAIAAQKKQRNQAFTIGTLNALFDIVDGMRELPGRKSVIIFSDDLQLFRGGGKLDPTSVVSRLRKLTDLANRAGVVFYTVDARGLQYFGVRAEDDVRMSKFNPGKVTEDLDDRKAKFYEGWDGLDYLPAQTGGIFFREANDMKRVARAALEDQTGYYVVSFQPAEGTFEPERGHTKYHGVSLQVKRPGLIVRTRKGFFGVPDKDEPPPPPGSSGQLIAALRSPFASPDVRVQMTALFGNASDLGSYMNVTLHVDGRSLEFKPDGPGFQKGAVDVAVVTFGDNGVPIDRTATSYEIRLADKEFDAAVRRGFLWQVIHQVKQPGPYQLRAVVRDTTSNKVGSASQYVEVPDVAGGRLALSGVLLKGASKAPTGSPERTHFRPGEPLAVGFVLYNPEYPKKDGTPDVTLQLHLFREGREIPLAEPAPLKLEPANDPQRITVVRDLQLPANAQPGSYLMQLIATDRHAPKKQNTAVQWTAFELVP